CSAIGRATDRADLASLVGAGPALGSVAVGRLDDDLLLASGRRRLGARRGLARRGPGLEIDDAEDLRPRAARPDDHALGVANHPLVASWFVALGLDSRILVLRVFELGLVVRA